MARDKIDLDFLADCLDEVKRKGFGENVDADSTIVHAARTLLDTRRLAQTTFLRMARKGRKDEALGSAAYLLGVELYPHKP